MGFERSLMGYMYQVTPFVTGYLTSIMVLFVDSPFSEN